MNALRILELWITTAWRAARSMTVAMCACVILTSTLPAISLLGLSRTIEAYSTDRSIWPGIVLAAAAMLITAIAAEATWPISDTVQDLVDRHIHDDLLRLTNAIPSIAHHEDPALADRLALIENDVNALVGGPRLLETIGSVTSTVTVTGLLASIRPALGLLLVVALLPAAIEARGARRLNQVQVDTARYYHLTRHCIGVLTAPRQGVEVRCFGLREPLLSACSSALARRSRPRIALVERFATYGVISWLVFGAAYALAVWWILIGLRDGRASAGDLSLLLLIGAQIVSAGRAITANVRMVADQMHAFARYQWLRDYSKQRQWSGGVVTAPESLHDGIRLRDVSFTYPTSSRQIVRGVDLHLPAGATVAFVGANGAGKSTLVKLLARLYDPTDGEILIDGIPLRTIDPAAWRARISAGFQDYARFEFIAADSIGVGDLSRCADRERIIDAVDDGQAQPVISGLPDGLDTQLGTAFEGGVDLSGGQWQRLALARAFMRDRPLLMLLDEPTAALDPQTEHALYEQYTAAARNAASTTGAVTVLVSHRFSTVRMADLIVVVEDGRISELGTHDALIRAGGEYARLFELQARAYR
ncbi:MAG TPA: ABC transporter ATP-binding protein [Mycobacteriales bacterium]|nr:ABC transporter ATP-binding protein [Mycobacteriales bacterium]